MRKGLFLLLMFVGLVLSIPFVMALLWTVAPAALAIGCLWLCWRRLRDGEWPASPERPDPEPSMIDSLNMSPWALWEELNRDEPRGK